jgi:hypothetical protein
MAFLASVDIFSFSVLILLSASVELFGLQQWPTLSVERIAWLVAPAVCTYWTTFY